MKQFYLGVLLLFTASVCAQNTVSGTITNDKDGTPVPFVNVILMGTSRGTVTNEEGTYTIEVADELSVLQYSSLGFLPQEVLVGDQTQIDIVLEPSQRDLEVVVVTALGVERNTRELGYAVQTIESKEIDQVKSVNFLDNLAGKLAGVTISQGATGVGSSSRINIRGEASFSNNNPLFIVDGVPINNNTVFNFTNEAAAGFQEVDFGNGAMEVNPDDVASVSVLKGPSAAALYGTRASNGVIVIETKDGSNSKGLGININSSVFVDQAFQLPEFQNQFGQGQGGVFEFVDGLGGGISDNITYSWGPRLDAGLSIPQFDSPVTLPDGTIVRGGDTSLYSGLPINATPFVSNPDNLADFYELGITSINNVSVSNGFDKGDFRLSFTDLRSESIIPGVNLDRQTLSTKLNFRPSEKTKIRTSINYVNSSSDNRPSSGYGSENVNYSLVAWGPRSLNIDSLRDYWQPGLEGRQQYSYNYTFFDNPFFILEENRNSFNRDRVFGNIAVTQTLVRNLELTVRSGMDYSNESRQFLRNFSTNRFQNGAYAEHDVLYREINTDFLLNYDNTWGDVSLDISAGGNRLDQLASAKQVQTTNLAQPGIFNLNNAASPIEAFQFASKKQINSFYGVAKLGYKDQLFLDVTARNDWSSALATPTSVENVSFFYPSASLSFIVSNTYPLPEVISHAQVRLSGAKVGNDTNPFQTSGGFVSQTPFNGQPTFSNQSSIPNTNLRPELTTSYEVGADIRFFKNRLNFDFTYYNALTEDQIISLPIAISSGYNQQVVNGGEVRTSGIEVFASAIPVVNDNFRWTTSFNFSQNKSIVESLPQSEGRLTVGFSRIYDSANQTVFFQVEEGGQIGDFYGTGYLRNGDGDFIIDKDGRYIADNNLKKLGNYTADFNLGWNNEFRYKKWSASFLIDWRQGGEIVSRTRALGNVGGQLAETADRPDGGIIAEGVVNVGTPEAPIYTPNDIAVSAESYYRQFYDRNHEENNIYDASFIKLRQVAIGYSFKLKEGFIGLEEGIDVDISIIGRNLFAYTENPHFDPEQLAVQGQNFVSGVEDMSYATTRSAGVKVGFSF